MSSRVDADVLAGFLAEARGYLSSLRAGVAGVRDGSGCSLDEAYRAAHCLRGTAVMLGLKALGDLAGLLEQAFEKMPPGSLPRPESIADRLDDDILRIETHLDTIERREHVAPLASHSSTPIALSEAASQTTPSEEPNDPELLAVFAHEAEDHLRAIRGILPALRERPGDRDLLQNLRRHAHTLKGSAATVGFKTLTRLAHRMEDLLDLLYEGQQPLTSASLDLLAVSSDALEDLAAGQGREAVLRDLYARYDLAIGSSSGEFHVNGLLHESTSECAPISPSSRGDPFVRVPLAKLDALIRLVSELALARGAFQQRLTAHAQEIEELRRSSDRLQRATSQFEQVEVVLKHSPEKADSSGVLSTNRQHFADFDELEFDRYTASHLIARELNETTADLGDVAQELGHLGGELEGDLGRQAQLIGEIQDRLMRVRLVPLATLATRLQRTVRSVADASGKRVDLVLEGEGTELDKAVLDEMAEPLLHLLRNAVDHGIESPAERRACGKPELGQICVRAGHEDGQIVLHLSDDGAGIDSAGVRARAIEGGFVRADEAQSLGEEELFALLFRPGFSTARLLSEVSGRGIGLDVVRSRVQQLRGTLTLKSCQSQGTTFTLRLPMTLAIVKALLVRAGGQTFAVPLATVVQVSRLGSEDCELLGTAEPEIRMSGEAHPRVVLAEALQLATEEERPARPPVVLLGAGGRRVALVVDRLLGGREIVVKSLGSHVRQLHGISGATLLGDGTVVLILNPTDLVHGKSLNARPPASPPAPTEPERRRSVLVVDDSPSVRRVVTNLLRGVGWTTMAARDGVEALALLHAGPLLPDLVLLDIEMPRMDGFELLGTIRAQPAWRAIPVVMLSSRTGAKHRAKARELGADAHLVKPCQEQELLATLRRLMEPRV